MKFLLGLTLFYFLSSCNQDTTLLEETLVIIHKYNNDKFRIIDNCHCTQQSYGGEAFVGDIIEEVNFGELDRISTLEKDSISTYIMYLDFNNGTGIDIIELIGSPSSPPITEELYTELESYMDGFSLSFKDKEDFELVLNNIQQIAESCGATVRIE